MQLPWFVLLGVLAGMMGALFLKMLRTVEVRFAKLPTPLYLRLGLGGLVVGVIALAFPGVWGNGYVMTNRILDGQFDRLAAPWVFGELRGGNWALLAMGGLLFGKLLATVATVSSGAVGGVFTPTLFLGAGVGGVFGQALHQLGVATELPLSTFALVGMGSVMSATTRSPLLAMILVFEISLNYSMPPLMLACGIHPHGQRVHKNCLHEPQAARLDAALESDRRGWPPSGQWAISCAIQCRRSARTPRCKKWRNAFSNARIIFCRW